MNRETARRYILDRSKDLLTPAKHGKSFICPICGSGSGPNGTGITTEDGIHFTCWRGYLPDGKGECLQNADIFDIIGREYGLQSYNEQLEKAADLLGITIDRFGYNVADDFTEEIPRPQPQTRQPDPEPEQPEPDYTEFYLQAHKDIDKTSYHRGIPLAILDRFGIGYVANWKHPKTADNPNVPTSPRLIIPTSKSSYLARDTRENLTPEQQRYSKSKVGKLHIFNEAALNEAEQPVFIVEGEIDAMSVIAAGGEAIALGSTANVRKLQKILTDTGAKQPLIIALDNDAAGRAAGDALETILKGLKLPYCRANITGEHKDANEALNADAAALIEAVQAAKTEAYKAAETITEEAAAELIAEMEEHQSHAAANNIEGLLNYIRTESDFIPTGFGNLDNLIDGGLYTGVHYIGAISSLGKTTFILQMADQIAQRGTDVLFFSLEQGKYEIMAKSISRITYTLDRQQYQTDAHARTTRGILTGSNYKNYSEETTQIIAEAIRKYKEYADRIYIIKRDDIGVKQIGEEVNKHIQLTGNKPIVFIDYLQMLEPEDPRATDKQSIDKMVKGLKSISDTYNVSIVAISSFNRDNYTEPVNLTSFKESGKIEYTSDTLIALQYAGMDYQKRESGKWETDAERTKRVRELLDKVKEDGNAGKPIKVQLKVLKQRSGTRPDTTFEFIPKFNYYRQIEQAPEPERRDESTGAYFKKKKNNKPASTARETPQEPPESPQIEF